MKVSVDLNACQGHARCQDRCPEIFATDEAEGRCVILREQVPPELQHKARIAVLNCPEGALSFTREPGDVS
jgi:ferredoxin